LKRDILGSFSGSFKIIPAQVPHTGFSAANRRKGFINPLIEDSISSELYFGKARPKPLKAFDGQDLVTFCSSFSKTLAPGLRIDWVIPARFIISCGLPITANLDKGIEMLGLIVTELSNQI
jgi:DNA-binding transcriptional MocR family regulator